MPKNLLIIESPAKARTIKKYLGPDFKIMASVGHVKDLPVSKLGVDIEKNFEPNYVTIKGKTKVLKDLKAAGKNAEAIYLAPDPDREGEAIAWHVAQELGKGKNKQKTISKNTLASNMRYFTNSIKECNEYIFWVDRYHDKESMKILISSFDQTKVKDIKIIASGFAGGTIDYELYSYIQSITKEFENDISLSFKIITNRDTHRDTHNRYILSSNVGFDVPSIDAIQKGQDSTINPLEPKILEHKKEVFLKNWENEQVLDIVKDWQKISKFLEENGNAKSYRRECQKCKNVFTCKPQFRDNPTCLECFRNTKH